MLVGRKSPGDLETADSPYGSDKHGLIWGFQFLPDQPAKPLDSASMPDLVTKRDQAPAGSFLWLHFSLSNAAAERWMRANLDLPDSFFESMHEEAGSTRLEQEGDALVGVIHDVLFEKTLDHGAISTVLFCIDKGLLVSTRLKPLRSVDRLRAAVKAGRPFRSGAELLAQLLREQAGVLVDIVRQSTTRVDHSEDNLLSNRISSSRRELSSLRRTLVRLQRLLAPEPAALFRLLNRPPGWIRGEDLQELRQAAEEFSAAVQDSTALVERVKLIQEEIAALVNEGTGRTLFTLTMVTVIALPINMVAGLFGMNLAGIPMAESSHGFWTVVGILSVVTGALVFLAFGRRRD